MIFSLFYSFLLFLFVSDELHFLFKFSPNFKYVFVLFSSFIILILVFEHILFVNHRNELFGVSTLRYNNIVFYNVCSIAAIIQLQILQNQN